jgi:predicted RNA binding protein YcfA (HicA-like mRNA interferase family)
LTLPGEVDGARFLRALARLGWTVARQRGSHRILNDATGKAISVSFHGSIRRGAIRNTLRLTGITERDFLDAL